MHIKHENKKYNKAIEALMNDFLYTTKVMWGFILASMVLIIACVTHLSHRPEIIYKQVRYP